MKVFSKLCLAVTPLVLLAACASTEEKAATPEQPATEQHAAPAAQLPQATPTPAPEQRTPGSPLEDASSPLSKRTIYFDFDKADIKPEFRTILQAHAEYLSANPNVHVVLEGNTDERGTREYNMGLGERRAKASFDYLVSLGVTADRLKTLSYGKEVPVCQEHSEDCWSRNRRDKFTVTGKQTAR